MFTISCLLSPLYLQYWHFSSSAVVDCVAVVCKGIISMFYVQLDIEIETFFGLLSVKVVQTCGKKEKASVTAFSFSAFLFSQLFWVLKES